MTQGNDAARQRVQTDTPPDPAFKRPERVLLASYGRRVAKLQAARANQVRALAARAEAQAKARALSHEKTVARATTVAHARAGGKARAAARAARRRRATALPTSQGSTGGYTIVGNLRVMVTAYWPDPSWSNGITATGMHAQYGIIAVDPRVIPFGTHMYVPGYGQGIAEDTGGAIQGDHIDVCFDDGKQAIDWGVQYLTIDIERPNK